MYLWSTCTVLTHRYLINDKSPIFCITLYIQKMYIHDYIMYMYNTHESHVHSTLQITTKREQAEEFILEIITLYAHVHVQCHVVS